MGDDQSRAGERYATAQIVDYCERVHAAPEPALSQAFDTPEQHAMPPIMVGKSEAQFLRLLVQLHAPQKIVEVGTLAGFSAISMAYALPEGGHLWTLENEPLHAEHAAQNLATAGVVDRVTLVEADAMEGLQQIEDQGPFDLVFLDADKERYDQYQTWAAQHLRPGGLLVADNAYYFGLLLEDDPGAVSVRRMHEQTALGFDSVCVPTPDGMLVAIKRD